MINYGSDCRKDVIKQFLEFVVMVYVKMCLLIYGGICGSSCDPAWLTGHALKSGYRAANCDLPFPLCSQLDLPSLSRTQAPVSTSLGQARGSALPPIRGAVLPPMSHEPSAPPFESDHSEPPRPPSYESMFMAKGQR